MMYEVPFYVIDGDALTGQFETTGRSNLDAVRDVFQWVAMAAGIAAMVAAIITPVPGSSVVAGLIWTSIFTSTAAAAINIGERYNEGFSNLRDDAFDTLTIVANLFAAGGTWMRGAGVIYRTSAGGPLLKGALIGQIGTASIQGVILGADYIGEYDRVMSDGSLTPSERTNRLLELFRNAAVSAALTYVSIKGTAKDIENLNQRPKHPSGKPAESPAEKLERLKKPTETVDLTDQPHVEGNTKEGKSIAKVQTGTTRPPLAGSHPSSGGAAPPENTISIFVVEGRGNFEMLKAGKIPHPYLYTGHVGFSFDGGETIWGFGPHLDPEEMSAVELLESLRDKSRRTSYPGKVTDDTKFFTMAAQEGATQTNRSGKPMTVWKLDITFSEGEFRAIQRRFTDVSIGAPLPETSYMLPPFEGDAANCATFPEKLGIPMPDSSGQVKQLVESMREKANPWMP